MILPMSGSRIRSVELSDSRFRAHNVCHDFEQPENVTEYFSLSAPPNSKIVRRQLEEDEASTPMILTKLENSFILAEVTISADFEMDWDQGGLIVFAGCPPARQTLSQLQRRPIVNGLNRNVAEAKSKWAKVGLEFTGGELGVSSVVANPDCGADSTFTPAFPNLSPQEAFSMTMPSLRVKLERVGSDLWIWYRIPDGSVLPTSRTPEVESRNWKKSREVSGFFDGVTIKSGIWVGCYASRPMDLEDACEEDNLFVEFEDLEIM